jgi:hypothetical protein
VKPSATLFELIQSLSAEEKERFLRLSSLQQGDKNYLKLFSHLITRENYNEEEVKKYFENEPFVKHLASEKNQLFHHLLKSLRHQRINTKHSAYAFDKIKDVELLYSRGLKKLAKAKSEELKQLVIQDELFYAHLKLINVEIIYASGNSGSSEQVLQLLNEKESCLNKINTLNVYQRLLAEIEYYFNQNILIHDRSKKHLLDNFLSNPYLKNTSLANSNKSLLIATYCRLICFRLIREDNELGEELDKTLSLFNEYPFLKTEFPKLYIHYFGFRARHLAINASMIKAKLAIDEIRNAKNDACFDTQDLQNTLFTRLAIYDLIYYNYSGNFQKAAEFGAEIEKELLTKKTVLPGHEYTAIQFLIFVSYFALKQYNLALKHLNEVLNTPFEEARQDLYRYAKICNLIVHYELNNSDYLVYNYKSVKRFFQNIDYPFDYETAFLKHFKTIAVSKKQKQNKQDLFKQLLDNLNEIFKDPYQKIASEYFDITAWVLSKINNTNYAAEIKLQRSHQ